MASFVTHLESTADGSLLDATTVVATHKDRPVLVRYDLDAVKKVVSRDALTTRPPTMWRYAELLPAPTPQDVVTLGEGLTPLLSCPRLADRLRLDDLWFKDESQLPTGSFKSRGMSVAITMARHLGVKAVALPTAGNAGGAMAAYAARAGMEAHVYMPSDAPPVNQFEARLAGAHVTLVDGLITDCGRMARAAAAENGWLDMSTLREPYRLEGKKTMGFEIAEQFGWQLPDVLIYPTGGGTGLIGMWKAFAELAAIGWLDARRLPRMVVAQSDGCSPIVRAFESGADRAEPFQNAATIASGLRVPSTVGDTLVLDVVRSSGGTAVAVPESRIVHWMQLAASSEGFSVGPESAVCVGAAESLAKTGWIKAGERVVLFNCGAAQKYAHLGDALTYEVNGVPTRTIG